MSDFKEDIEARQDSSENSFELNEEDVAGFESEDLDSPAQGPTSRQNKRVQATSGKCFTSQECQKNYNSLDTLKRHVKIH